MSECSVLVEQYSTASVMSHMKMTRQVFVLEVLNCILQSNDVPFPRNVFFDGAFFSSPRSMIPVQNAEACSSKRLGTSL